MKRLPMSPHRSVVMPMDFLRLPTIAIVAWIWIGQVPDVWTFALKGEAKIDLTIADGMIVHGDASLLRVVFQTVPALNYTLALSGVRARDYLIGTSLGLPLPIALYCLFFDYLAKALKIG